MEISINDLDDDDVITGSEEGTQQEPIQNQEPSVNEEPNNDDYISDFLRTRGIDDLEKINFEDDEGQLIERSWNDLSKEEKLNILNTPLEQTTEYVDNSNSLSE